MAKTSANQVAALARDENKAADLKAQGVSIRIGDYDDTAALEKAMQGIDKVLLETSTFAGQMKERGVPELMVRRMEGFLTDIKNGQEDWVSPDLEHLLGRKPTSLREGLKALFKL